MRALLPLSVAVGCTGETSTPDADDSGAAPVGFTIEGSLREVPTRTRPSGGGLCAQLLDADRGLTDADALDTIELDEEGDWAFVEVTARPEPGLLVSIDDCEGAGDVVPFPTVTGIAAARYADLPDGETVHADAWLLTASALAELEQSATAIGWDGALKGGGFLIGYVLSADTRPQPIGGATVACSGCGPDDVLYLDPDPEGGWFGDGATENAETDPALGAFLVPEGIAGTYEASDPDGELEFVEASAGGLPDRVVVFSLRERPDDSTPQNPGPGGPTP